MARVRLTEGGTYDGITIIKAEVVKSKKTGSIDAKYLSRRKLKELAEDGYAYVNQPAERIV